MEAKRDAEATQGSLKLAEVFTWSLRKEAISVNIKVKDEAAHADVEAAARYPGDPAKIANEGAYSKQIFNAWLQSFKGKAWPSFKGLMQPVDSKLKPVLISQSENPGTLKNEAKSTLPVLYKRNKKAWMTAHLVTTWLTEYCKTTVESYCPEKNMPFKIWLLIDDAPGHPRALMETDNFTPC